MSYRFLFLILVFAKLLLKSLAEPGTNKIHPDKLINSTDSKDSAVRLEKNFHNSDALAHPFPNGRWNISSDIITLANQQTGTEVALAENDRPICSTGFTTYAADPRWCLRVYDLVRNWGDAQSICDSMNSWLVQVSDLTMHNALRSFYPLHYNIWIGWRAVVGGWIQYNTGFGYWSPGQPDMGIGNLNSCGYISGQYFGGMWDDMPCYQGANAFVCQRWSSWDCAAGQYFVPTKTGPPSPCVSCGPGKYSSTKGQLTCSAVDPGEISFSSC